MVKRNSALAFNHSPLASRFKMEKFKIIDFSLCENELGMAEGVWRDENCYRELAKKFHSLFFRLFYLITPNYDPFYAARIFSIFSSFSLPFRVKTRKCSIFCEFCVFSSFWIAEKFRELSKFDQIFCNSSVKSKQKVKIIYEKWLKWKTREKNASKIKILFQMNLDEWSAHIFFKSLFA